MPATTHSPAPAAGDARASGRGAGTDPLSRVVQVIVALVIAAISVMLMVTTHRAAFDVLGVRLPVGLLLGGLFQLAASVFLVSATGRRLPLVVLAAAWGVFVMPLAGTSAGGGVLMPGVLAGVVQYQGWIVQALGVGIPLLVLAVLWVTRMRALGRGAQAGGEDSASSAVVR